MNMWIVVLIMVPVLAIMIFGKNPIREFQNEQKALVEKYGGDELTIATSRFVENSEKASGQNSSLDGVSSKEVLSSIKNASAPIRLADDFSPQKPLLNDNINNKTSGGGLYGGRPSVPSSSSDDVFDSIGKPQIQQQIYQPQQMERAVQPENSANYYPPIIADRTVFTPPQPVILKGKEARLRSGQVVIFEGASVYTVDAAGGRVPMPDGEYVLQDGGNLIVSNGRSVIR